MPDASCLMPNNKCSPPKEDVRRQAFMVLCTSIDLRALSISDRVSLLKTGFGDRCGESTIPPLIPLIDCLAFMIFVIGMSFCGFYFSDFF